MIVSVLGLIPDELQNSTLNEDLIKIATRELIALDSLPETTTILIPIDLSWGRACAMAATNLKINYIAVIPNSLYNAFNGLGERLFSKLPFKQEVYNELTSRAKSCEIISNEPIYQDVNGDSEQIEYPELVRRNNYLFEHCDVLLLLHSGRGTDVTARMIKKFKRQSKVHVINCFSQFGDVNDYIKTRAPGLNGTDNDEVHEGPVVSPPTYQMERSHSNTVYINESDLENLRTGLSNLSHSFDGRGQAITQQTIDEGLNILREDSGVLPPTFGIQYIGRNINNDETPPTSLIAHTPRARRLSSRVPIQYHVRLNNEIESRGPYSLETNRSQNPCGEQTNDLELAIRTLNGMFL